MDAVQIGQITNADVYLGDNLCVGRFNTLDTPDVEYEGVKHAALGMVAEFEGPGRLIKALKVKGETDYIDVALQRALLDPVTAVQLTVDAKCDIFDATGLNVGKGYRVVTHISILPMKTGQKSWKFGNDWKGSFEASAMRYVQKLSSEPIPLREIDVMAQLNRVNGRDVFPQY